MRLPARDELTISLIADRRLRLIAICAVALTLLVLIRSKFVRTLVQYNGVQCITIQAMRAEEEDLQRRLVVDNPDGAVAAAVPPAE